MIGGDLARVLAHQWFPSKDVGSGRARAVRHARAATRQGSGVRERHLGQDGDELPGVGQTRQPSGGMRTWGGRGGGQGRGRRGGGRLGCAGPCGRWRREGGPRADPGHHPLAGQHRVAQPPPIGPSGQDPLTQLLVAGGQARGFGAAAGNDAGVRLSRFSDSGRTPGGPALVPPSGDAR
jgi:hypothetical protein